MQQFNETHYLHTHTHYSECIWQGPLVFVYHTKSQTIEQMEKKINETNIKWKVLSLF